MKLLLDQNISYRLVKKLSAIYPETEHVTKLGLTNKTDREIWETAKAKGYTIVTLLRLKFDPRTSTQSDMD